MRNDVDMDAAIVSVANPANGDIGRHAVELGLYVLLETPIADTQPGQRIGDIFKLGMAAYTETGYPEEWQLHHQGGLAGYEPREIIATPDSEEVVSAGQVYAWNPFNTGTKSEDTLLITEQGCQILTQIKDWPTIPLEINGQAFFRPSILERKL